MNRIKRLSSRIFAASIALAMMLFLSVSSSAIDEQLSSPETIEFDSSVSLNILSGEIPVGVSEYAQTYFQTFNSVELSGLGFTESEMANLRLAPGFTAYEYDPCDALVYYFPVINEEEIIAILKVIDYGYEELSVQFGKCDLAENLNDLTTSNSSPIAVVLSDEGFYSIDTNDNLTLLEETQNFTSNSDMNIFGVESVNSYPYPDTDFDSVSQTHTELILIDDSTEYSSKIKYISPLSRVITDTLDLPVVLTNNVVYNSGYSFQGGACGVMAVASIIGYHQGYTEPLMVEPSYEIYMVDLIYEILALVYDINKDFPYGLTDTEAEDVLDDYLAHNYF
jgi:hypothetical protein